MQPQSRALASPAASLIAAALLLFAVRMYVCAGAGLTDDEAYYRIWSLAPALSYLDHPPMVAWIIAAGRTLAGDTPLGIRLLAPAAHVLGLLALWRTALLLFDGTIADRAGWFLLAMPLVAVGGVIVTPDLPSVLFSGLVLWSVAELDRSQNANWLLATGLFAGLGLLSKYTGLFLGATVLIWLVAVPANRRWFRTLQLWLGGAIAVLLAIPVIVWNAEHEWASFAKQFGRVARSGDAAGHYELELVGGFFALASPVIAVLAVMGLIHLIRSAAVRRDSAGVLIAAAVFPMLGYFLIHALHDRVQANWLAPLYPPLAICAAVGLSSEIPDAWRRACTACAVALGMLSIAAIYWHAVDPFTALHLRKDPTAQMRGWTAFGEAVEQLRRDHNAAWVATSSYATTGQLAFALKGRSTVEQLDQRIRYAHLAKPADEITNSPALYVELARRVDEALLRQRFGQVTQLPPLIRADGSSGGTRYAAFLVAEPLGQPLR